MTRNCPSFQWLRDAMRFAAALFLLGFMGGDLVFPRDFCEEYYVYPPGSVSAVMRQAVVRAKYVESGRERASGARLDDDDGAGTYVLHIVHPPIFSLPQSHDRLVAGPAIAVARPLSSDPDGLDHPPRSL